MHLSDQSLALVLLVVPAFSLLGYLAWRHSKRRDLELFEATIVAHNQSRTNRLLRLTSAVIEDMSRIHGLDIELRADRVVVRKHGHNHKLELMRSDLKRQVDVRAYVAEQVAKFFHDSHND